MMIGISILNNVLEISNIYHSCKKKRQKMGVGLQQNILINPETSIDIIYGIF